MSQREEKRAQFESGPEKRSKAGLVIAVGIMAIIVAAAAWFFSGSGSSAGYVMAQNGKVSIPLADVNDGLAHYYKYKAGSQTVSFFLLKSSDGTIRAALDACDVCYKALKGYRQEGDFMVCNNCNQRFQSTMINVVKGGCNPAPLTRDVANGQVVLHERELIDGVRYFPTGG